MIFLFRINQMLKKILLGSELPNSFGDMGRWGPWLDTKKLSTVSYIQICPIMT